MFACEPSAAAPTFRRVFVTDRLGCALPLPQQTAFLAESGAIDAVILREKDLDDAAYELLAAEMAAVCARCGIAFVAHAHVEAARRLGCAAVHLPLPLLRAQGRPDGFAWVGTNVHEADEVAESEVLGADVLVASPVFAPRRHHRRERASDQGSRGRGSVPHGGLRASSRRSASRPVQIRAK